MRPRTRGLVITSVAVLVVAVVVGSAYFYLPRPATSLPLSSGTLITKYGFNLTFAVAGGPGRLVGAWYANHGGMIWVYPSNSRPPRVMFLPCIGSRPWNGTADVSLGTGLYTMEFDAFPGGTFLITRTIQLVYPGDTPTSNSTLLASWCGA